MRPTRILIPLAVLSPLALAAPALAADASVNVVDFAFEAKNVKVGVGEKVTWNFTTGGHTTTSDSGQAEKWNSGPATSPAGDTYEKTFTKPGRFTYICLPHQTFMKGTVTVGTDKYKKSYSKFSPVAARQHGHLQVHARRGRQGADQAPGRGRSAPRRRSGWAPASVRFALKNMEPGKYNGTATFTDDFGKKSVVKISTTVPLTRRPGVPARP